MYQKITKNFYNNKFLLERDFFLQEYPYALYFGNPRVLLSDNMITNIQNNNHKGMRSIQRNIIRRSTHKGVKYKSL